MSGNKTLIKKVSDFVFNMMKENLPREYVYHDFNHTIDVVEGCKEIGEGSKLDEEEMEIVTIAAWFHDVGYIDRYENHEERGAEIAEEFLSEHDYPRQKIERVKSCILSTKLPQTPKNLTEEVLCDAEFVHFGKKNFFERIDLLRVEWEKTLDKKFDEFEWIKTNIDFLVEHPYHTRYAQREYEERRNSNISKLQKKLRKLVEKAEIRDTKLAVQKEKLESEKDKKTKPERGIETMFRVTMRNHIELSGMADNKANIMISVNTIIISFIVAVMIRKLDTNPYLTIPTFILLFVSLATIIFATIVTRPKITAGTFTKEDIQNKKANLLFFGNFFNTSLSDFEWGMNELMKDKEYLYGSMIKDFYFLGKVIGKKYKYLSICYNIFMYGMIIAVIAFVIAFIMTPQAQSIDPIDALIE